MDDKNSYYNGRSHKQPFILTVLTRFILLFILTIRNQYINQNSRIKLACQSFIRRDARKVIGNSLVDFN